MNNSATKLDIKQKNSQQNLNMNSLILGLLKNKRFSEFDEKWYPSYDEPHPSYLGWGPSYDGPSVHHMMDPDQHMMDGVQHMTDPKSSKSRPV